MTQKDNCLAPLWQKIRRWRENKDQVVALLDLDSSLYDVGPRTQQILLSLSEQEDFRRRYPEVAERLQSVTHERQDWGPRNALSRLGLLTRPESSPSPWLQEVILYWKTYFFSNHFLQFDRPYPGAVEFVSALQKQGVHLVYLTGRDRPRMEKGTLESLKDWGFPQPPAEAKLQMKPSAKHTDVDHKVTWTQQHFSNGERLILLENEPVNINAFQRHFHDIEVLFFDSTHSGKESLQKPVHRISQFAESPFSSQTS